MIDYILLGSFFAALFINPKILPSLIAYALGVVYQFTLFDVHSDQMNHVIYGLIFIPAAFFVNIHQAKAICIYSGFHALYAVDAVVSGGYVTYFSIVYNYIQITLAFSIIVSSFIGGDNVHGRFIYRPFNLYSIKHLFTYTKASERT